MSLLHKNGILKEYRRQHRAEVATRPVADTAIDEDGAAHNSGEDDEFPDVAAFQVIGSSSSNNATASPAATRPSQHSVMSTMGEGTRPAHEAAASSSSSSPSPPVGNGDASSKYAPPPPLTIRTAESEGRPLFSASRETAAGKRSGIGSPLNDSEDSDNDGPPFASPKDSNARVSSTAASGVQKSLGIRSRSDLTGDEQQAAKESHLHSPGTDPTVSPTKLTTGAETFLTAMDAAEGVTATGIGATIRPTGGGLPVPLAEENHQQHHHMNNNNSSITSRPVSTVSGPPLSPSTSRPPQMVQVGQLHVAQSSAGVDGHRQTTVDVSCSSSSSSCSSGAAGAAEQEPTEARRPTANNGVSLMSEEAVARLGPNHTNQSMEGETVMTGGSPTRLRQDISDTMLQPPTSILSEPSTLDTTTANLASLRSRSQARRALEKSAAAASGKQNSAQRVTSPQLQQPSSKSTRAAGGGNGAGEDEDDEDVYSRVSVSEMVDGVGSPLNGNASLVDTRIRVVPSSSSSQQQQHLLSFSGTARTLNRFGEDEDVDVDPSSLFTDPTARGQPAVPPITFYEAYAELMKEMQHASAAKEQRQSSSGGGARAGVAPPAARTAAVPAANPQQHKKEKKSGLASLFGCCGPHEADIATRQPPAYATASADLDRVGATSVRSGTGTGGEGSSEDELKAVQFLKTRPLSLQNSTHRRMLFTIFNVLTGLVPWPHLKASTGNRAAASASPPPSSMRNVRWESIGFQGSNPATDVRATGVWGVLQLLYLLDYYPSFAKRLWDLCQNPAGTRLPAVPGSPTASPPRTATGISNQLPFVLVCFNFTAVVLDAAGQHLLDGEIRKAKRSHLATAVVPAVGPNKPEAHLSTSPGTYVCCEAFVGALELFGEAWYHRPRAKVAGESSTSPLPPLNRPSVADFGEVKSKLRMQIVHKGGAALLQGAVEKVRAEALLGFE